MSDPSILVLSSLAGGDKHGYAMMEDIERFAGVRLGPGTLYGAITRLEEKGWIAPVGSGERRQPYKITGAGRDYLHEQLGNLGRIVRAGQRRLENGTSCCSGRHFVLFWTALRAVLDASRKSKCREPALAG